MALSPFFKVPERPLSLRDKAAEARRAAQRPPARPGGRDQYLEHLASWSPRSTNLNAGSPDEADAIDRGREESARQQFIKQSVNDQNDAEPLSVRAQRIGSQWSPFFDQIKATEAAAAWEGKGFDVDLSGIGQSRSSGSGGSMPQRRRSDPLDGLGGSGGGRFDVSDDPRVQQALVRQALDALDPMREEAERGREMQDSALERNASEQRSLRTARDVAVPMNRIKQEMGDFNSESEARRQFLPYRSGEREQDYTRKLELATAPARIAGDSRENAEQTKAWAVVQAALAKQPDMLKTIGDALGITSKGGYGLDADGRPLAPPADLVQGFGDKVRDRLNAPPVQSSPGRTGGAGPTGAPAAGGLSPEIEGLIEDGIANGLARDRADAITKLRQRGIIR